MADWTFVAEPAEKSFYIYHRLLSHDDVLLHEFLSEEKRDRALELLTGKWEYEGDVVEAISEDVAETIMGFARKDHSMSFLPNEFGAWRTHHLDYLDC